MTPRIHPVVVGGTLVAVLDIAAAFAVAGASGVSPVRVLQSIASGLLGAPAFQGGVRTAALGMFLHVVIAFAVAALYYTASRRWLLLVRHPIACGLAYGVGVYAVMNLVVLPLSRVTLRPPRWQNVLTMVVIHVVCVGLPAALPAARAGRRRLRGRPAPDKVSSPA